MKKITQISGEGCAGCYALLPQLTAIALRLGVPFERIDIETSPEAVEKYNVARVPTVILWDGDREIARCTGYQPEEILSLWIESKFEECKGDGN